MRVVIALGLLLAATPQQADQEGGSARSMSAAAAERAVVEATPTVELVRGLVFKEPVPVRVVNDAVVREHLLERLWEFYTPEELRAERDAYVLLGLVPPGTDILGEFMGVAEEQVGGFYDPSRKAFFLLEDMPAGLAPLLAAHELTHALEDQYFDMDGRLGAVVDNDDMAFAVSAVHEGSATLVMTHYMMGALAERVVTPEDVLAFEQGDAFGSEKLMAMPEALRRPLLGAYLLGMNFLSRDGKPTVLTGFPTEDVNRAYRDGPVSSEQILHPEKYWDPDLRDDPTPVDLGSAGRALGRGWRRLASGVLGELLTAVLVGAPDAPVPAAGLEELVAAAWTHPAAVGWDGDRWELWGRGRKKVVLLLTVWDSPVDALEFDAALRSRREHGVLRREGDRVAVVAGRTRASEKVLDALLASGPETSRGLRVSAPTDWAPARKAASDSPAPR